MGVNWDQCKEVVLKPRNWQPRFACKFEYIKQDILRVPFKAHLVKYFVDDEHKPEIFISEAALKCDHRDRFENINRALKKWNISQITTHTNRIWIKHKNTVLPAFVRWSELGKLGAALDIEIADLTRYVLELKAGKLVLTDKLKNDGEMENIRIREKIAAYLAGNSQEIPPVLFADVTPQGEVMLHRQADRRYFYLKLPSFGQWFKGSMAAIRFLSRTEVSITIYKRDMKDNIYTRTYETPLPGSAEEIKPLSQKRLKQLMASLVDSRHVLSKKIAGWIWGEGKLEVMKVERKIGNDGICQLCSVKGLPYRLRGVHALYPKIELVKIVLKETKNDTEILRTATLYPATVDPERQPKKWFAVYKLPLCSYEGELLHKKDPAAR